MIDGRREEMTFAGFMWRTCLIIAVVISGCSVLVEINEYQLGDDGWGTYEELTEKKND